jgi:hypothetical protein
MDTGTCIDLVENAQDPMKTPGPAGFCVQGGSAALGSPCESNPNPPNPVLLCAPALACVLPSDGGVFNTCGTVCDPTYPFDGGLCGTGEGCACATTLAGASHGHLGYCASLGGGAFDAGVQPCL